MNSQDHRLCRWLAQPLKGAPKCHDRITRPATPRLPCGKGAGARLRRSRVGSTNSECRSDGGIVTPPPSKINRFCPPPLTHGRLFYCSALLLPPVLPGGYFHATPIRVTSCTHHGISHQILLQPFVHMGTHFLEADHVLRIAAHIACTDLDSYFYLFPIYAAKSALIVSNLYAMCKNNSIFFSLDKTGIA